MVGLVLIALKIVLKNGKDLRREYFDIFISLPDDRQKKSMYSTFVSNLRSISIVPVQQSEQENEVEMTTRTTMRNQADSFELDPDLSWEDFINHTS